MIWRRYKSLILSRGFIISAISGILIILSGIISLFPVNKWIYDGLAIAATIIGGAPIVYYAIKGLLKRQLLVGELVSLAMIAAVIYGEYFSAALVAFMMQFGTVLEDFTIARAKNAVEDLGKLAPSTACVRRNGVESILPIGEVKIGDLVIVKPGERLPVDGEVVKGQASVNQAAITGESMPVSKIKGSEVFTGTLNELGYMEISTTKLGESTALGQITHLVKQAEENRAPIVRMADKYAKYFTPAILALAVIVYLVSRNINHSLAVLIVACPCSLVIATPTAIIAGVANGARRGILIKGGARLEGAGKVTAVALDKTGTITIGQPQVIKVVPFPGFRDTQVLDYAAIAEKMSEHPMAKAIMSKAKESGINIADAAEFHVIPGRGVIAIAGSQEIVVGTRELLQERKISMSTSFNNHLDLLQKEGLTSLIVTYNGAAVGLIGVADVVREEVKQAIQQLKDSGVKKVVMLTGDNAEVAKRIAISVGIDEWQAGLLPQEKVEFIKKMQAEGYKVAMIGDGINDAPALAQSDVGIAMGAGGTDVAMDTADIVLMTDNIIRAAEAIILSRKTFRIIKQNLAFALVFNLIGITAASVGGINPVQAALFHNIGSIAVIVNSARLAGTRDLTRDYPFLPRLLARKKEPVRTSAAIGS